MGQYASHQNFLKCRHISGADNHGVIMRAGDRKAGDNFRCFRDKICMSAQSGPGAWRVALRCHIAWPAMRR